MDINIAQIQDEELFEQYRAKRERPRTILSNGVYPNCVVALAAYEDLLSGISGDLSSYADYHANITANVAPHIDTIKSAMQTIVSTMQAIEAAAPGTFGIEVPTDG